jgi:hypothetical protein
VTKPTNPVLTALFALEDHVRALPKERRAVAIELAVSRLRRLTPRRRGAAPDAPDPDQLDLERELASAPRKR